MFGLGRKEPEKTPMAKARDQLGSVPLLRIGMGLGALALLWVVSQFIWAAVSGAMGILALATVGIIGIGLFQALPLLGQKWENRLLASRKGEARKNPIEQAQNEYLRRCAQYESFKSALEQIGGQISSFEKKLQTTRAEKPKYDLSQEMDACAKMKLFYANRKERLQQAHVQLIAFHDKIDEAQTKWDFQLQANQTIRAMNATDREAKMNEILTDVAFDTVQQEFDAVFAKLDVDAAEISANKQLAFGEGAMIDVSALTIQQPQLVGAR